ncbi:uncharacterized protein [Blastocystis hominis]|uniref:UDENN domain-containing protein n=1 Tax=Blastocystis hominis TaxID=12968 RepID=D8MB96_BLAHO|nr:uncharacterized protein [Blastocystis hominis]CBK25335.2 unnamed protein product [Blastocystis hominis]|eukprot:XP_012899383.1 uncharacterized protein [Blastocystis hominis]
MSVTVPPTEENIGRSNPPIVRIMQNTDFQRIRNTSWMLLFCYLVLYSRRSKNQVCSQGTADRSRSYGTSLFYYEKMKIDGECKKDKKGRQLYVPRALCILSHQPFFTAFNVFLRELYRNAILDSEDQFADENDSIPRVESFEALLRKGSLYDTLLDDSMALLPLEKHIQHFIDFCPSLDPGFLIHLPVFQKIYTIRIPPLTRLPYTDKLCFKCLFTSLSPKNIVKVYAAILQEQRVLFVSEQMDSLTLCAQAFNSLLYPFRWFHPFIPILPFAVTETISASFPYIFGVTTNQFETEDCQNNLDGVIVVYLDYDKVVVPKSCHLVEFRKSFVKKVVTQMENTCSLL